jgi:hypothetical protein
MFSFHALRFVLVFGGGTEGVGSRFHVLRSRTNFRLYRGRRGPIFIFCASKFIFGCIENVISNFHVLHF